VDGGGGVDTLKLDGAGLTLDLRVSKCSDIAGVNENAICA
jgi:hypothetical protein